MVFRERKELFILSFLDEDALHANAVAKVTALMVPLINLCLQKRLTSLFRSCDAEF